MVFSFRVQILHLVWVIYQRRNCPDESRTVSEHVEHAFPVLVEVQPVVKFRPAIDPVIDALVEVNPMCRCNVRNALPAGSLRDPDGRIRPPSDVFSPQPFVRVLDPRHLCKLFLRAHVQARVRFLSAPVPFHDPVGYAVRVHCPPAHGKGFVSPVVVRVPYGPLWPRWKRVYHMAASLLIRRRQEVLEELALKNVPAAL